MNIKMSGGMTEDGIVVGYNFDTKSIYELTLSEDNADLIVSVASRIRNYHFILR